jgi:hypothetical protein
MIQPRSHVERYSIWVDPDVAFSPRRIEIVSTEDDDRGGPNVIDFEEYRELAPGIWYPMKHVNEFSTVSLPEGASGKFSVDGSSVNTDTTTVTWTRKTHTHTASEASTGKSFAKDSLLVKFPSGTKVFVNDSPEPITSP